MKYAFATCVQLGKNVIETVYSIGGKFEFLVTLNDNKQKDKSGRIYLDDISERENIPLIKIDNINDYQVIEAIKRYNIDWFFIIGWSQIAYKKLLVAPKHGCIGMHPTLLPNGRGRASIPWAILKNLDKTGVTLFKLDEGVDTGDILGQVEVPIEENENAESLYRKVSEAHNMLIRKYWRMIEDNLLELIKQDDAYATVWPGRKPEDGELFNSMTVDEAERLVRAVTRPYPGAFYNVDNKKIVIWKAKKTMIYEENAIKFINGYLVPIEYEVIQ